MKIIEKTYVTYVANDGKRFDKEADCLNYEKSLTTVYFGVYFTTNTSLPYHIKLVATENNIPRIIDKIVRDITKGMSILVYVDGVLQKQYIVDVVDEQFFTIIARPYSPTLKYCRTFVHDENGISYMVNDNCEYYKIINNALRDN